MTVHRVRRHSGRKATPVPLVTLCLSRRGCVAKKTHGRTHPTDPKCEDPNASGAPSCGRRIGLGESSDWKRVFPSLRYALREERRH